MSTIFTLPFTGYIFGKGEGIFLIEKNENTVYTNLDEVVFFQTSSQAYLTYYKKVPRTPLPPSTHFSNSHWYLFLFKSYDTLNPSEYSFKSLVEGSFL